MRGLPALIVVLSFAAGVAFGILFQRYYGAGKALRLVGIVPDRLPAPSPRPAPTAMSPGIAEAFQGRLSLFILAGQSNMSGRGNIPANQEADPQIFVFGNDYRWRVAIEPIDSPEGQVDAISADTVGDPARFGPSLAFAKALREQRPDMVIGLVPCAKGDTSIVEWQRSLSDSTLYGSCIKRARAASVMGQIAGLLYLQGEADAVDPDLSPGKPRSAHDYAAKFSQLAQDFRRDLAMPRLPIVFAQIGTHTAPQAFVHWEIVKQQQTAVQLSCATMITTDDLPLQDAVHFTTESYRTIGQRFAKAFVNVIQTQQCE